MRFGRLPNQAHSCFIRCAATLAVIAAEAGGDNIIPALLPARGDGHDVVERKIFGGELPPAILTRIVVPSINIGAGKLHPVVVLNPDVFEEANNRRQLNSKSYGVDFLL